MARVVGGPTQLTYTALGLQAVQMVLDQDEKDDLLSDDSLEREGDGSDSDNEIHGDIQQLLLQTLQHSDEDGPSKRASVLTQTQTLTAPLIVEQTVTQPCPQRVI